MFTLRDDNQFLFVCPIVPQFVRTELQLGTLQSILKINVNPVEEGHDGAGLKKKTEVQIICNLGLISFIFKFLFNFNYKFKRQVVVLNQKIY